MDVDIDFADRNLLLDIIPHRAATLENGAKHNTGIYGTAIPWNPLTGQATINYKQAEERGYFKIDFLNVNIYKGVRDEGHLDELMNTEPEWELLQHDEFVNQVFHLSGHGPLCRKLQPTSVDELAMVLAIIRPSKRYLAELGWDDIRREVWKPPYNGDYYFKKAHAFSYAIATVVHMNLLCEQIISDDELTAHSSS